MAGYDLRVRWPDRLLCYPHPQQSALIRMLGPRLQSPIERLAADWNRIPVSRLSGSVRAAVSRLLGRPLPASGWI
jgi:hypothetical protein